MTAHRGELTAGLPPARSVLVNPSQDELRSLVEQMPNAVKTEFGNFNVTTRVTSRSAGSTFLISDDPDSTPKQTMSRADYAAVAARQEAHIAERDMILMAGYIGPPGSPWRRPARVFIERDFANIPAMQQQLYFPVDDDWRAEDALTVIYTPS